jgi:hypothetical protein
VHELIPVGPLRVRVKLPDDVRSRKLQLLVLQKHFTLPIKNGWATVEINSVRDHEVLVIG